jgi:hypothetical protein
VGGIGSHVPKICGGYSRATFALDIVN